MKAALDIDFSAYRKDLQIKKTEHKTYIFDPIRKKQLVLQPEELVRQLVIQHLLQTHRISSAKIAVEKALKFGKLTKRFDLMVYQEIPHPFLLIECKAFKVAITEQTLWQAAWYNFQLRADYLLVTNGLQTYCAKMDYDLKSYNYVESLDFLNESL